MRAPESRESASNNLSVDASVLSFAEFVAERQAIWHRRCVLDEPGPWTGDPILSAYRFTNVQRELDRGTITVQTEIAERDDATLQQKIFNMLIYRVINRDETWRQHVGFVHGLAELRERWSGLRAFYEEGGRVWTSCWVTNPLHGLPGRDRIERVLFAAETWEPRILDLAAGPRTLLGQLCEWPALGPVVGWQITLDLGFIVPVSQDEWVPVHSTANHVNRVKRSARARPGGSRVGAELVRPGADPLGTCIELRDTQDDWLPSSWAGTCWAGKPRLTLADVEHSLCEYAKYHRKATGAKTYMRRFP